MTSQRGRDEYVPHRELARVLDEWVDAILPELHDQPDACAREGYLDLLVGLADAADALRAGDGPDGEDGLERLRSALHHLRRARTSTMHFPSGRTWHDLDP